MSPSFYGISISTFVGLLDLGFSASIFDAHPSLILALLEDNSISNVSIFPSIILDIRLITSSAQLFRTISLFKRSQYCSKWVLNSTNFSLKFLSRLLKASLLVTSFSNRRSRNYLWVFNVFSKSALYWLVPIINWSYNSFNSSNLAK